MILISILIAFPYHYFNKNKLFNKNSYTFLIMNDIFQFFTAYFANF